MTVRTSGNVPGVPETTAAVSDPCAMLGTVESRPISPVFVGRAPELTELGDALARAGASREPQALLIGGEAGVGKTRLIEEFCETARGSGAQVALGGCIEIGSEGLPFAPFSSILHTLNAHLRDELAAAVAGQEGELARILPELGETAGEIRDEEIGRARLFELTARLLERLAAHRTLVIVVEDLHWADRSTRELLAYLLRALHDAGIVLIATYRSDDIHRRHPLRPFLAEIDRMRTVRRIELGRFNRDEVRSQIAGIRGSEPAEDTVDRVFKRSEGNAFFVEELARGLADGCLYGLSDPLRDLLLVRVEALPEDAQRVVRIAAEAGSTVEHELLAAVCQMPEDDLIEALRPPSAATPSSPPRTAPATASGTPWSARPSSTTCCPASAPASTADTPRPWKPTPAWSAPRSAPPAWPVTGTRPTTPPRHCPPSSPPPCRPAAATPTPSNCACWTAPWSCGTTPRRRSVGASARSTTPRATRPAAATTTPCASWTCSPRSRWPPACPATASAPS